MIELVRPSVLATERSISPVTMMNVIGSATRMIGIRSRTRKVKLRLVPKLSTVSDAATSTASASRMMMPSQVPTLLRSSDMGVPLSRHPTSRLRHGRPSSQRPGDPDRDQAVRADGQDDQRTDDGLLPE